MMAGHDFFTRNRSRTSLTNLNRAAVSASYNTVRRSHDLLASYDVSLAKDGDVPLPSNLTKSDFTQGMLDNSDYDDRSSISDKQGKHYASGWLAQDATCSKQSRKPLVSETNLKVSESLLKNKLDDWGFD